MQIKKLLFIAILFCSINCIGQNNFKFSPEKPQAGDLITITYVPGGDIANNASSPEAVAYFIGTKDLPIDEIPLKKSGNTYTGTVKTDTSNNFVYFAFTADKKFDNNYNNGYWIQLYDGDKLKKGANASLAFFYEYFGRNTGVDANKDKALAAMENEFQLYPESRKPQLITYASLYSSVHKDEAPAFLQKEIEQEIRSGLKDEDDYNTLQSLYSFAKLPQQSKLIGDIKKEKFPNGKWTINENIQKFMIEKDIAKKEQMLDDISTKIKNDSAWKNLQPSLSYFQSTIPSAYVAKQDWEGMKNAVKKYDIKGAGLAALYNNTAWEIQKTDKNLKEAEDMSEIATNWAKQEWKKPTEKKPGYLTVKQWNESRANTYAMYADSYAMINYKLGNYKKGFPYTKEAALEIGKGQEADENNTYALLAEKTQSPKKYVKQLEQFVKDGKSTSDIKEILKRAYLKNHDEKGFEDHIATLEKASYLKMMDELKKGMLNDAAPSFTLVDLKGEKVNVQDLKNKVVIVDFWATWCGPCKASFPGMQKMVVKYKEDPEVKFVFVDTWETNDNKEKNAGDFITANKYDFHVLMDNDSKVVEQFKVSGIPTKFVIDKKGNIRFKAIGFDGSDDKLVGELSAMIDIVKTM
ncbi:MAG: TlpA family protein disulfide reductase [Bacteroidota bacterium]|nr:TlpA family protein disulfide reductase [Bacteroidota bacterium]